VLEIAIRGRGRKSSSIQNKGDDLKNKYSLAIQGELQKKRARRPVLHAAMRVTSILGMLMSLVAGDVDGR